MNLTANSQDTQWVFFSRNWNSGPWSESDRMETRPCYAQAPKPTGAGYSRAINSPMNSFVILDVIFDRSILSSPIKGPHPIFATEKRPYRFLF